MNRSTAKLLGVFALLATTGCWAEGPGEGPAVRSLKVQYERLPVPDETTRPQNPGTATFAAGCFWCVEEVFHQAPGVTAAISGYMGGTAAKANYDDVSYGRSDHAEAVQVTFDRDQTSFEELATLFYKLHDPTQVNRQGPDRGRQYRSAIFYHDEKQEEIARRLQEELDASGKYRKPIATQIVPAMEFYPAEDYHQNYARLNPMDGYIRAHLVPKLAKLGLIVPSK